MSITNDTGGTLIATLNSTLIANNAYGVPPNTQRDLTTYGSVSIVGYSNLIRHAPGVAIPGDTLHDVCPLLGPLRNNGGTTFTHALLSSSPAIDHGANLLVFGYDQRGAPDARVDNGSPTLARMKCSRKKSCSMRR